MLCEKCHENNATLYVNEYINGKVKGAYLCNKCAKMQGNISDFTQPMFGNLLSGILEIALGSHEKSIPAQQAKQEEVVCSNCKMTASEFRKGGRFGCRVCYESFERILQDVLTKIQPSNEHVGKVPKRLEPLMAVRREIENLNQQLKQAIQLEEYEQAATLRDAIKELEKGDETDE